MKSCFVLALLVAVAVAVPVSNSQDAGIVKYDFDNIGVDGYSYSYETSDGTAAQEAGALKNVGSENEALQVQGSYKFVGDDGQVYSVSYVADENGFQPQGAHIPK